MLLEPSSIVLYVHDLTISSTFYRDLLGIAPEEASATFHTFKLSHGMGLALKAKHTAEPPVDTQHGHGELAFTCETHRNVDELFNAWKIKNITMLLSPSRVPYGYTFVALDPDGNRLRVVALNSGIPIKQTMSNT